MELTSKRLRQDEQGEERWKAGVKSGQSWKKLPNEDVGESGGGGAREQEPGLSVCAEWLRAACCDGEDCLEGVYLLLGGSFVF